MCSSVFQALWFPNSEFPDFLSRLRSSEHSKHHCVKRERVFSSEGLMVGGVTSGFGFCGGGGQPGRGKVQGF